MKKDSFVVYTDIRSQVKLLTLEQTGALFVSMLDYAEGVQPEFADPLVQMAFSCVQPRMDRDRKKYEEVCRKRQEAGKKGGRPRKDQQTAMNYEEPIFLPENQKDFLKPEHEHEYEYEHEHELDNDHDCELASKLASASAAAAEKKEPDELSQLLVKETGITPTAKQKETMEGWCKKYGKEAVVNLIHEAKDNNAHTFAYLVAIVRRWERDGGPSKPRRRKCQGPQPCATPTGATQAELDANRQQLEKLLAETAWMDEGVSA